MSLIDPQPLYSYGPQSFSEVRGALDALLHKKEDLPQDQEIAAIMQQARLLKSLIESPDFDSPDKEIASLFDVSLVDVFLKDTNDSNAKLMLSTELGLLTMLLFPVENTSYSTTELLDIFEHGGSYDKNLLLFSLRQQFNTTDEPAVGQALIKTLPRADQGDNVKEEYFLDNALLFSMIMLVVWKSFSEYTMIEQEFLITNYFYRGLLAGARTREYLLQSLILQANTESAFANWYASMMRALEWSQEGIPTSAGPTLLGAFTKQYIAATSQAEVGELAQEKFIQKIASSKEMQMSALREACTIINHLQKRDL